MHRSVPPVGTFLYTLGHKSLQRLDLRVQSPGWLWYFILGPVPALMGLRQYSFCQRSPLSCLVVVLHLKESISAHSACAHDKISYQMNIKPGALLTHLRSNHLLSQLLLWPLLLSELQVSAKPLHEDAEESERISCLIREAAYFMSFFVLLNKMMCSQAGLFTSS